MREIKFRAWDVKSERMSDPFFVGWKQCNFGDFEIDVSNCRCKVMQFTGLHDSTKWEQLTEEQQCEWLKHHTADEWDGWEIYEGDIVELERLTEPVRHRGTYWKLTRSVVEYRNQRFYPENLRASVVTGNIFENPNLLEQNK